MLELQPIHEQDMNTVNYSTQNLLSSGGKATRYTRFFAENLMKSSAPHPYLMNSPLYTILNINKVLKSWWYLTEYMCDYGARFNSTSKLIHVLEDVHLVVFLAY